MAEEIQKAEETTSEIKYYGILQKIQLNIKNYPNEYPLIWAITSEEIIELKRMILKSRFLGLDPSIRKACFSSNCTEGLKYSSIIDKLDALVTEDQISRTRYSDLIDIPAWNPFKDLRRTLETYIEHTEIIHAKNKEIQITLEAKLEEFKKDMKEISEEDIRAIQEESDLIDAAERQDIVEKAMDKSDENDSEYSNKITLD